MKKLNRINLNLLAIKLPVLDEQEERAVVGGQDYRSLHGYYMPFNERVASYYSGSYYLGHNNLETFGRNPNGSMEDDSWWSSVTDMMPVSGTGDVTFSFAAIGGMSVNFGIANVFQGEDAGGWYGFTTVNGEAGAHIEASFNGAVVFYTGDHETLDFESEFGGIGYSIGFDLGIVGVSLGMSNPNDDGDFLFSLKLGWGPSVGETMLSDRR